MPPFVWRTGARCARINRSLLRGYFIRFKFALSDVLVPGFGVLLDRFYSPPTAHRIPKLLATLSTILPLTGSHDALAQLDSLGTLPSAASINLCADQLLLSLADESQIRSISWLAQDSNESMLAHAAAKYPINYGSAEEILRVNPDIVIAGAYTNGFTRSLLQRLEYTIVEVVPATDIAGIERNLSLVGNAINQPARVERAIEAMRRRAAAITARQPEQRQFAIVVRPGGYTSGANSLPDAMLKLAGFTNLAALSQLDRWGSVSIETLLSSPPALIVITDYRQDDPSLANAVLQHPALAIARDRLKSIDVPGRYWSCGLPETLDSAERLTNLSLPIRDAHVTSRSANGAR